MTLDVIKNMVYQNSYFFSAPKGIRCIDDRDDRQTEDSTDPLPDVAIPAAGIGIILGVLGGMNLMEKRGINHNISRDLAYRYSYDVTGGMPYHSDEKRNNDSNPAAGCGHFALALQKSDDYLLSEEDLKFFTERMLPDLEGKRREDRILYSGGHEAKAVVVLESFRLGLPALLSNGDRVYVYSKRYHQMLIDEVAYKIEQVEGEGRPDRATLGKFFTEASEIQLGETLKHLASAIPSFSASSTDKEDVIVTLIK